MGCCESNNAFEPPNLNQNLGKPVTTDSTKLTSFYKNPEGALTVAKLAKRNEDNQFSLKISSITDLNHDTIKMRLEFPDPEWIIGEPVANHIMFYKPKEEGETSQLCRQYVPVTPINTKGYADFIIKCYARTKEFPEGGKMTLFIRTLSVGDNVLCNGPMGKCSYMGDGVFVRKDIGQYRATNIGLIAGGSGITPILSVLRAIYKAKETHLNVTLLYSNKTRDDILCKPELDAIANDPHCTNIKIYHTITREEGDLAPEFLKGRVTLKMLQDINFP